MCINLIWWLACCSVDPGIGIQTPAKTKRYLTLPVYLLVINVSCYPAILCIFDF